VTTGTDRLRVIVSDNGTGFDPSIARGGHLGLSTMAQRADAIGAELTITSRPGTTVTLLLPVGGRDRRAVT
jgi:signal transduction histidine kinase